MADGALGDRAERASAGLTGTHDLDEGAQGPRTVDHLREDALKERRIPPRQKRQQKRRHVLHAPAPTRIQRDAGQVVGFHPAGEVEDGASLFVVRRVVGAVEATRRRVLGQLVARAGVVAEASSLVDH
jgi:hypothetical protein